MVKVGKFIDLVVGDLVRKSWWFIDGMLCGVKLAREVCLDECGIICKLY